MDKTLTEMLRENLCMNPECDAEAKACEDELVLIKDTFKGWLRNVGLPQYHSPGKYGVFNATESIQRLLINLVDEPSRSEDEANR